MLSFYYTLVTSRTVLTITQPSVLPFTLERSKTLSFVNVLLDQGEDVIEPSLQMLASKAALVNHPIWANADIVMGPGTGSSPIDPDR